MSTTRIKICGVNDPGIAAVAAGAGADAIGLVFVEGSPRRVSVDEARDVIGGVPPFVEIVGLFVDTPVAVIRETVDRLGVRTVQLHGRETPEEAAALAPLRVIKAFGFADVESFRSMRQPWSGVPNLIGVLLDTPPRQGELTGGTGRSLDWDGMAEIVPQVTEREGLPIMLAGGLDPQNVCVAVRKVRPYAVDVSSGVESSRGVKDRGKIEAFCSAVRAADRVS